MSDKDERRITPTQAMQAANYNALRTDVKDFLDAMNQHGLIIDVTKQEGIDLLEAKDNLEKWFDEEDDDDEEED